MRRQKHNERGMALLLVLIALLIVTSIGLTMMYSTDTETTINGNYRDEQTAYYASKAGLEEARDRMQTGATNTISANLPTALPGAANGVLYITNPTGSETVAPWTTTNTYFDDEICKEVNCSGGQVPPTSGWYRTPVPTASSTYAASPVLPYKWMRITLKTDASASGWSGSTHNYMYVDGKSADASYYVCWNSTNQHEFAQSAACASPNYPVYMMTALAITPSGSRRMVQYELT
jgi:Tfp pilus assembly protein PilX